MLILFMCWFGLSLAWSNDQVRRLELVYERANENIESAFHANRLQLPQRYMTALRNMEAQFLLADDDASAQSVRRVRQQFVLDPTPAGLRSGQGPEVLEQLQAQYQNEFDAAAVTRREQIEELQRQYRSALSRVQIDLQRQGSDAEARRVGEVLASLRAVQRAAPPPDDLELNIDLGLDFGTPDPAPASGAARPSARPAPQPRTAPPARRAQEEGDRDPFDALLDEWLD